MKNKEYQKKNKSKQYEKFFFFYFEFIQNLFDIV